MIQVIIYNEINVACFQEKWGSNISFSYITQIKYRFDCWLRQAKEATDIFILKLTNNDSFFVFCFFLVLYSFLYFSPKFLQSFPKKNGILWFKLLGAGSITVTNRNTFFIRNKERGCCPHYTWAL